MDFMGLLNQLIIPVNEINRISVCTKLIFLSSTHWTHCDRSITTRNFLTAVRSYLKEHCENSPMVSGLVTCTSDHTVKELIQKLDSEKIHRIYVVDNDGNLEGVITLRDIISRLVHEPRGYFGDFFDGVLPLPQSSRV